MEAKDYYGALHSEVTAWKGKVDDLVGRFEDIPEETRNRLGTSLDELRRVMEEHSERMDALEKEFPAEWRSEQAEKNRGPLLRRLGKELTKYRVWHLRHL
jgi:hypothetical protein